MYEIKIFEENNEGPNNLEERINSFFEENEGIKLISSHMCVEKVTGIDYKSIVIIYEKTVEETSH